MTAVEDTVPVPTLRASRIAKSFGPVAVLRDVDLTLYGGEIHALVGENGAGKSTLTKILSGVIAPDRGHLEVDGMPVALTSPLHAQHLGVTIVFQEPNLFPDLSVAENIFIGRQPRRRGRPWLNRSEMSDRARALLSQIGSSLPPDSPVRGMSIAEMQMIEIATAMSHSTRLLIVDEPTASLTPTEVERLFSLLRTLSSQGVAVLFIGHRLEEVFEISDRLTVLRDGAVVGTRKRGEVNEQELINLMVGRDARAVFTRTDPSSSTEPVLQVKNLSRNGVYKDISMTVNRGEILGVAGLVGAGRSEIARAIFGIDSYDVGSITVSGAVLPKNSPIDAVNAGVAYVPEDRKAEGLAERLSIAENLSVLLTRKLSRLGWVHREAEAELTDSYFRRLDVRARSVRQPVGQLSGGNQQKVVIAKWLATDPKILILDEPTRGVDVGAKEEIHRLIDALAQGGMAILLISSDLPEILAMADRLIVIREGRVAGHLGGRDINADQVMALAASEADPNTRGGGN